MSRLAVRTMKISLKRAWIPSILERCLAYFVVEGTRNTKDEPYNLIQFTKYFMDSCAACAPFMVERRSQTF